MIKLMKGNNALVEGSISAGLDAYFGYPITPQNEITESMSVRMREEGRVFLQTESELASVNMIYGVAMTGKKALTSSSSPGISLMQETISYMAGCELPTVIVNVQRGGPGLGNISGAQGDYFQAVKGGGHGDYKMIVLTPSNVQEMYEMPKKAFYLAFKYKNPVMILADGVIGQMIEKVDLNELAKYPDEDEVFNASDWALTGCKNRSSRFIRSLIMEEGALTEHNYKLLEKFNKMEVEVDFEEVSTDDADVVLVGYGTSARIIYDAYLNLRDSGFNVGYLRPKTVFPFPSKRIAALADAGKKFMVVEMSSGQMVEDVRLAVLGKSEVQFYGIPGGGVPEVETIISKVKNMM
ncbi:MAG: 3-methyl-2-oxobutanoate dehydrogenase subunit VorB [bacterium]|nr:3-methyl-2-oxobutanoate dehydrogenase subunit VorB [bacterium]